MVGELTPQPPHLPDQEQGLSHEQLVTSIKDLIQEHQQVGGVPDGVIALLRDFKINSMGSHPYLEHYHQFYQEEGKRAPLRG
jgi:hypothetical protein